MKGAPPPGGGEGGRLRFPHLAPSSAERAAGGQVDFPEVVARKRRRLAGSVRAAAVASAEALGRHGEQQARPPPRHEPHNLEELLPRCSLCPDPCCAPAHSLRATCVQRHRSNALPPPFPVLTGQVSSLPSY